MLQGTVLGLLMFVVVFKDMRSLIQAATLTSFANDTNKSEILSLLISYRKIYKNGLKETTCDLM